MDSSHPPVARRLSQAELAAVLRRATELDAEGGLELADSRLDPAVVEAAAIEAGLSRAAVRQALNEVLHPDVVSPDPYAGGRLPTRSLVLERVVPGTTDEIETQVGRYLRRQLFDQQRVFADGSRWAPRRGWLASVRKRADPGARFVLNQVHSVQVTLTPAPPSASSPQQPSVLVRISLDLTGVRSIHATWIGIGGAAGGAAIVGAATTVGVDPVALLSLPVAGGLTTGGHFVGRREARREVEKIHTAVAGLLDRLEHGERAVTRGRRTRPPTRARRHERDERGDRARGQEDDR
ncbi:MAG: hypothetical protein ACLFWR_04410 [Acidimicrobiales bacterium]